MTYTLDSAGAHITSVTVSTTGNTCAAPIPVTFPGTVVQSDFMAAPDIVSDGKTRRPGNQFIAGFERTFQHGDVIRFRSTTATSLKCAWLILFKGGWF